MTCSDEISLLARECLCAGRAALHGAQIAASTTGDVSEIAGTVVGYGVMLQVSRDAFDGSHVWCIGGQVVDRALAVLSLEMCALELRAVCLQPAPDDEQRFSDRGPQGFKSHDDLWILDRTAEQVELEESVAQGCNDGALPPAEAAPQDWSLASRGPRSRATRFLGLIRFVDEDDYSALPRRFFFSAGGLLAFHARTARSSGSRVWPVGRCTTQPNRRSGRRTDEATIFTAKFVSISCANGGNVHSSVGNPVDSAPSLSSRTSALHCASVSRSGSPKCVARFNAYRPPSWRARSQRITVWRETPTWRGTSAWFSPGASRLAPRRRRRSSAFSLSECVVRTTNGSIRSTWRARSVKNITCLRIFQ